MDQYTPSIGIFKRQLSDSVRTANYGVRPLQISKSKSVYLNGDEGSHVYFIESGRIKLTTLSPAGKECILAIYSDGDIFGEMSLSNTTLRRETAIAMTPSILKKIPHSKFLAQLTADSLLEGFIRYLAVRISDQQDVINNLVTVDSEQRLGKTLLQLARKAGKSDPRSIRFAYRITHEELSGMVGTTRPRISKFMRRFQDLGLIAMSPDRFITVKEKDLTEYLERLG